MILTEVAQRALLGDLVNIINGDSPTRFSLLRMQGGFREKHFYADAGVHIMI